MNNIRQLQLVTKSDGANTANEAKSSGINDDFSVLNVHVFWLHQCCTENILSSYIIITTFTSSLDNLLYNTLVKNAFLELNTTLPANTAFERLFSTAVCRFMPNRTTETEAYFKQQFSAVSQNFNSVKFKLVC